MASEEYAEQDLPLPEMARAIQQRVIITGASSGIGAALARRYAGRCSTLGLIARRQVILKNLATELGCECRIYPLDVRDDTAVREAAADYMSRYGCPDVVIANAGVSTGTITEYAGDIQTFQDIIDINLLGILKTFQPFVASMREARKGALVGIASVAGYRGLPGVAAYSASKAAVISYLESLRVELRGTGVDVITICPGFVSTPLTENNSYPMPFLMNADASARRIVSIIDRGKAFAVIPWQMGLVARVLRVIPNSLYDRILRHAPRKPRR